jgi:hypothetical protein
LSELADADNQGGMGLDDITGRKRNRHAPPGWLSTRKKDRSNFP